MKLKCCAEMNRPANINVAMAGGWTVCVMVDDDNHLNIYLENETDPNIVEIDTGQDTDTQLARRFTTLEIEDNYTKEVGGNAGAD